MITGAAIEHYHLGVQEPNIKDINWRSLLRKYQLGTISMAEINLLRLYMERKIVLQ